MSNTGNSAKELDKKSKKIETLREMGTVELLSREHEIEIAQRIDDGKLLVLKSMCESPITMKKLIKWYEDLVNEKIILRDLIDLESHIGGEEAIIDEDSEEKVDMREYKEPRCTISKRICVRSNTEKICN